MSPYIDKYDTLVFENNTAEYYGSKISSGYPAKIKLLNESLENITYVETINSNAEEEYTINMPG